MELPLYVNFFPPSGGSRGFLLLQNSRCLQFPLELRHGLLRHRLCLPFRETLHVKAPHTKDFSQRNTSIFTQLCRDQARGGVNLLLRFHCPWIIPVVQSSP